MARQVTFETFNPRTESVYEIGNGVVEEMAQAFDYELTATPEAENLGGLIASVGPAKELQENIGRVQEKLGTDNVAVDIARGWVERSGLLTPVERAYMRPEQGVASQDFDLAVISGGVRNWMVRRAERLLPELDKVSQVLLVAGNRVMKAAEGPDVEEDMTEADYMGSVVQGLLTDAGVEVEMVRVDSGSGNQVMDVAAEHIDANQHVLIASNAGAWIQNAGQLRRATRSLHKGFDDDGSQLYVVSDSFPLGTGIEPTATHQNPFTALGQIARGAQELTRHQS